MIQKQLICPKKVRRVPKQFSWVDHRLVRDHIIEQCSHSALALYLFLVTVGDQQGLSYYSDQSLSGRLSMDLPVLTRARNELIRAKLIAYRKPLCQILSLEPIKAVRSPLDEPLAVGQILKQLAGGAA
ncbi:hypothetical protein KAI46_10080 [bacterium]|nr:hypothetical protein [bacterium]